MKHAKRIAALCLAAALFLTGCASGASGSAAFSPENPVTVTVWHYYNGPQQQAFADLVNEFNETVGREKGIAVQQSSQATVTDLETSVLAAANREVGAPEVPNIFAAYADTAYAVDRLGLVADLRPYLTDEELAEYVPGYLEEGAFSGEGTLKIFPIAKSVELLMLNATDWEKFAAATGADDSAFATVEGITETARQYYEWTDAQTPDISDDGKAFFCVWRTAHRCWISIKMWSAACGTITMCRSSTAGSARPGAFAATTSKWAISSPASDPPRALPISRMNASSAIPRVIPSRCAPTHALNSRAGKILPCNRARALL